VVESKKIYWDERVCEGAALDDIDEEKIGWFLRKAKRERRLNIDPSIPVKEALNRIDLLKDGKLTNAAVLMFGKNPQKFLLQGKIKCAKFKGTKYVKPFIDMKVVLGGVYEQIDEAEKFVLNNIRKEAWTIPGQVEREEKWEYPPDAIREAIANAVAHRDYQSTANVHVSIFDDRVEVWSPGKLPEPLTPDDLKKEHKSIPINPLLAQALFLIKYIETWGTGTNDIVDYCVEAKLPEPIFQEASGGISVVLRKSRLTEEFLDKSGLNERQRKAIAYTGEKKQITNSIYREINDIGKVIAAAELNNLVDKKMLKVVGRGRATKYVLND
jgi:ATP-dependent DNA helicase RecG